MTDYAKLKNAELEAILKERGLPHTGKKAEMVARLDEDDKKKADENTDAPKTADKVVDEDEIDWDDDEEPAKPAAGAADTAAATPKAAKPAAAEANPDAKPASTVPEAAPAESGPAQPAAEEPVKQADEKPAEKPAEPAEPAAPEAETKPPVDFSAGLSATDIDSEIAKRKARAAKFGTGSDKDAEEALRKLERARKFGESAAAKGLDEALPEKRERKRGREDDGERRGNFKRRGGGGGGGGSGGRGGRPFRGGRSGGGRQENASGGKWTTDADRKAAEARKARFAAASS